MCRNIKPLFNFDPPATKEEIQDASLQFVRKISGFKEPSHLNDKAFTQAVSEIDVSIQKLLDSLVTNAKPKNREVENVKRQERSKKRFGI